MKTILTKTVMTLGLMMAAISSGDTQKVWQRHIDAWVARDIEAIVADYREESVVLLNDRAFRGKTEIKALFEKLFTLFDRAEMHEITTTIVEGRMVYLLWKTKIDGILHPLGTDTFFIDKEAILYQTITSDDGLFLE